MSKSNGDETFTDNETANREDMEKDKEDACDIDENFLGEVKQEPMSPPRSDSLSLESSSISASPFSYAATPLTRQASRSKLKNEWPKFSSGILPQVQTFTIQHETNLIQTNENESTSLPNDRFQDNTTTTSEGSRGGLLLFLTNPVVESFETV